MRVGIVVECARRFEHDGGEAGGGVGVGEVNVAGNGGGGLLFGGLLREDRERDREGDRQWPNLHLRVSAPLGGDSVTLGSNCRSFSLLRMTTVSHCGGWPGSQ